MIRDHLAHALTWGAMRCMPWQTAVRAARVIGHLAPTFTTREDAERALTRLRGGTCLSRSLAISSRLPESEIVFGVRREGGLMLAHAWVVYQDRPLVDGSDVGQPIASVDLARGTR